MNGYHTINSKEKVTKKTNQRIYKDLKRYNGKLDLIKHGYIQLSK